jgi:glucose/arabinose dehydrogenase
MQALRALLLAPLLVIAGCFGGSGQSMPPATALGPGTCVASSPAPLVPSTPTDFKLEAVPGANGLPSPMDLQAPAGDTRLFVAEREGRICVVQNGVLLTTPFLDISSRVTTVGEAGLISFAFDPNFASNGFVYVHFIENVAPIGDIVVERYTVSGNSNVAHTPGTQVIRIPHQQANNHFGGRVAFGPDGMLYLSTGDGGGGDNQFGHAQDDASLLGKLLRLDVRALNPSQSPPYATPVDNPTWSGRPQTRREISAIGLRNPFRYAFDGNQLYIADVGQNLFEEVDVVDATAAATLAGLNYGWSIMEGTHCFQASTCDMTGLTLPVIDYGHGPECAIIGGYVYRGSVAALTGKYLFSDLCDGLVRTLSGTTVTTAPTVVGTPLSFGKDGAGEIYVLTNENRVLKFVSP